MDRNTQHNNYLRAHILRSRWYRVFIAAAAIVVFITTYMLILPAITLDAKCGKEEHTHADACYTESLNKICKLEETGGHTHTDACYQTTDKLICGLEESDPVVVETVNEETGEVTTVVESEGHAHSANCYTQETKLICGTEESAGHQHTDACYKKGKTLTCGKEEHKHTDSCYAKQSSAKAKQSTSTASTKQSVQNNNSGISLLAYDPTFPYDNLPLSNYITSVSGEGTKLEPGTDHYTTNLTLNFRWDEAKESDYGYDPNWRY